MSKDKPDDSVGLNLSREYIKSIWEISKHDIHSLDEDEQLLAFIMKDHEDLFGKFWNNMDEFLNYEFDPDTEINPFLHVTLHHVVETQIRRQEPPEVEIVFQALGNHDVSRHDAIHMIAEVLISQIFAMEENQGFDVRSYLHELIKLPMNL